MTTRSTQGPYTCVLFDGHDDHDDDYGDYDWDDDDDNEEKM